MNFFEKKIGHSLGLRDTNVIDSVMFAAYSHPCRLEQLYRYDLQNIQMLYGCGIKSVPSPKCSEPMENNEIIESNPKIQLDVCNTTTYDSIMNFRGAIFIFKNQVSYG